MQAAFQLEAIFFADVLHGPCADYAFRAQFAKSK